MSTTSTISRIGRFVTCMIMIMTIVPAAKGGELTITKTWTSRDTLTAQDLNESFDQTEIAVTDNAAAINGNLTLIGGNFSLIEEAFNEIDLQRAISLNPFGAFLLSGASFRADTVSATGIVLPDGESSPRFVLGFVLPFDYFTGDPVFVDVVWYTQSTNCDIVLRPAFLSVARDGQTHLVGDGVGSGFNSLFSDTLNAPTTANQVAIQTYVITAPDGTDLEAGDAINFGFQRRSGDAADTCTESLFVQGVNIIYG